MKETLLREILAEAGINVIHRNRRQWLVAKCPFAEYLHEYGTDTNPSFFIKIAPDGYSGYNCFSAETKYITKDGVKTFAETSGTRQIVMAPDGKWVEATISCYGVNQLRRLTLSREGSRKVIFVTGNHRWFMCFNNEKGYKEVTTDNLVYADRLINVDEGKALMSHWQVESVHQTCRFEEVYCAYVPSHGAFVLDDFVVTGNCFTCKQTGNLTRLFDKLGSLRGHDYNQLAIRALLEETPDNFTDWDDRADEKVELTPLDTEIYFRMYPPAGKYAAATKYLGGRDISLQTVELLQLRFDPDESRILFPVFGNAPDQLFGFTGRTTLPKEQWPSKKFAKVKDYSGLKKDRLILGEHLIQDGKPILLVEGLFAYANMYEIGADDFCSPVASMGSHLSEHQAEILVDYGLPVYLLYDNDAAGRQGLYGPMKNNGKYEGGGAVDKLRNQVPTMVARYPSGVEDPDALTYEEVRDIVVGNENFLA